MVKPVSSPPVFDAPETSDEQLGELLRAVVKQDKAAFRALYDATVQRLYGIAQRITHSTQSADEAVGDLYLQVWQQSDRYNPERGSVLAWMAIMCRSRALDIVRRGARTAVHEEPLEAQEYQDSVNPSAQDVLAGMQRNSSVHDALRRLDKHQRQLVSLAYFRDYSHSELSTVTGLPIGTVKSQLRRAVIALRALIEAHEPPTNLL